MFSANILIIKLLQDILFHVARKVREFIISLAQNLCIFCHFLLHKICYPLKKWVTKNLKKTHLKFMVSHKYKKIPFFLEKKWRNARNLSFCSIFRF